MADEADSAALTRSARVQGMPCGPSSTTTSSMSAIRPGSRLPVLPKARIWSASPWMA